VYEALMIDLATYEPRGDKKNSSFFEDNLPRVYERRSQSGLSQLVGAMAAVVVQVDHGDGLAYIAELAGGRSPLAKADPAGAPEPGLRG
jgi:hypothetical protein